MMGSKTFFFSLRIFVDLHQDVVSRLLSRSNSAAGGNLREWRGSYFSLAFGIFLSRLVFFTRVGYFSLALGIFNSHLVFFTRVGYFSITLSVFQSRLVFFTRVLVFCTRI